MVSFVHALLWTVLSVLAILTDVFTIVIITRYRENYTGTDITLLALLATMLTNATSLVLLPAVMALGQVNWPHGLCRIYVWMFNTLRTAGLMLLLCITIHWVTLARLPPTRRIQLSTRPIKVTVVVIWMVSVAMGVIPATGILSGDVYSPQTRTCLFLSYDAGGIGIAVFFIILTSAVFFSNLVCLADTGLSLKATKTIIVVKYQAGRFYNPAHSEAVWKSGRVSDAFSEINHSFNLCKLVTVAVVFSSLVNHVPYTCIEFVQLFCHELRRELLEVVMLWLILAEALLFPHCLWLVSRRYRRALLYMWRFYVLRDSSAIKEDPRTCTLQSYRFRTRNAHGSTIKVTHHTKARTVVTQDKGLQTNGSLCGAREAPKGSPADVQIHKQGRSGVVAYNGGSALRFGSTNGSVVVLSEASDSENAGGGRKAGFGNQSFSAPEKDGPRADMRRSCLPAAFDNEGFAADEEVDQKSGANDEGSRGGGLPAVTLKSLARRSGDPFPSPSSDPEADGGNSRSPDFKLKPCPEIVHRPWLHEEEEEEGDDYTLKIANTFKPVAMDNDVLTVSYVNGGDYGTYKYCPTSSYLPQTPYFESIKEEPEEVCSSPKLPPTSGETLALANRDPPDGDLSYESDFTDDSSFDSMKSLPAAPAESGSREPAKGFMKQDVVFAYF